MRRSVILGFLLVVAIAPCVAAQAPRELRWAADPEGGAPYVEANPSDPSKLEGFEVDIADLLARRLGRAPRFVFVTFQSIDQAVARGDADLTNTNAPERMTVDTIDVARRAMYVSLLPVFIGDK